MKYTRYIAVFVTLILATACAISELDDASINAVDSKGQLQVVGRISQFSDKNVETRSKKDGDEPKVTSMGLALFPIENGAVGNCIYYDYKEGSSIVFIVDRNSTIFNNYTDTKFAMYIFANMQGCADFPTRAINETEGLEGIGKSLEYFTTRTINATQNIEDVPENGFPMMGSLGDNISVDGDGGELILKPTADADNVDGLPKVNDTPTDNLEIPLKAMYAKFSFTISVKPDQEIVGNKAPRFDVTSYTVHNIAKTIDCNSGTNSDTGVITESYTTNMGNYAQGATSATFDFYLPERYLTPAVSADSYGYPFKGTYDATADKDQNGIRDEDEKYRQRFKPLLPGDAQMATYLTIVGKYLDHQGYTYDVSYDIYLGADNYSNFDIVRNTHYDNTITIKGISSSNDQAVSGNAISIDHRVNVDRSTPLVINFRRETLLDAHFEVRPLRLRLVGNDIPTGASATIQILNEDGTSTDIPSWVRLEASGNTTSHITSGISAGKRKYFTTDLVTTTLKANTSITLNELNSTNQTVWIYVDEADPTKATTSKSTRAAIIRVTYTDDTGAYDIKDYKINQYNMHKIEVDTEMSYLIECHEEYLYNYDAEDSYGQTEEEGLPWGLNEITISNEHRSITASGELQDWLSSNVRPYYDFYIKKHDSAITTGTQHEYAGRDFTKEIFTKANGVDVLQMDQKADGAVEYCYNRNKRNADGSIAKVEWYLPSADELEDIIVAGYSSYQEFQDKYYWTSQPAYIRNYFFYHGILTGDTHGPLYEENDEYARATKVRSLGNDQFAYVASGLNDSYEGIRDDSDSDRDRVNLGYYFEMPYYDNLSTGRYTTDQRFQIETGGYWEGWQYIRTYDYFYVHLGHLYDLAQDGYHPRTKSNRIRCAYKKVSTSE